MFTKTVTKLQELIPNIIIKKTVSYNVGREMLSLMYNSRTMNLAWFIPKSRYNKNNQLNLSIHFKMAPLQFYKNELL